MRVLIKKAGGSTKNRIEFGKHPKTGGKTANKVNSSAINAKAENNGTPPKTNGLAQFVNTIA